MTDAANENFNGNFISEHERQLSKIKQVVDQVKLDIAPKQAVFEQVGHIVFIRRVLQELHGIDTHTLQPARELGFNLTFTPPVDIPAYAPADDDSLRDETLALAHAVIGRRVEEYERPPTTHPATLAQLASGDIRGALKFSPTIRGMSAIGYYLFTDLDEFDGGRGAMVQGKPMQQVKRINIEAMGISSVLVRPPKMLLPDMSQTITLPEIDEWSIARLAVIGVEAKEAKIDTKRLQPIFAGMKVDRIFSGV